MPVEFTGGAWWPERRTWALGSPIRNTLVPYHLGIPDKRCGIVCRAPHTGTLTGFAVTLSATSGSSGGGAPAFAFSLQGVDPLTGAPDGTNQVSQTVLQADYASHTWYRADVGDYAVTRGDLVACTMEITVEGTSTAAFWTCVQQPANLQGPPWIVAWTVADGWTVSGGSPYMPAGLILFYEDDALSGPPDGLMPLAVSARISALTTVGPVGMAFTVPRSLRCSGLSFHHTPTSGTTLSLYENDGLLVAGTFAANASYRDWEISFPEITLRPGRAYRAELTAASPFEIKGYRSVLGPAGARPPGAPTNVPISWPGLEDTAVSDFEGGPTWLGYGDDPATYTPTTWSDDPPLADRWFMSLHLLGDAEELVVTPTAAALPRCVVIPVCPEEEEPGPASVTPSVFAAWQPGRGPLRLRARRR